MSESSTGRLLGSDQSPSDILGLATGLDGVQDAGALHVTVRPDGDVDVVVPVGGLDLATVPELASAIDGQLIQGRNHIVVDLDGVTFFDARAIDAIITATCAAALTGGRLLITHNPRFMRLLELTCEVHRVNVTETLGTSDPELPNVHGGSKPTPESVDGGSANPGDGTELVSSQSCVAREARLCAMLNRSATGDESAFADVYDATSAIAYGLGERLLRDPALAAEAVRAAYIHLWEQSARFEPTQGSAISWILMTVHRCCVARAPSRTPRLLRDDRSSKAWTGPASGATSMLSRVGRQAVELAYFEGYTHTEIEQTNGLPVGTGHAQIRDALLQLRAGDRPVGASEMR